MFIFCFLLQSIKRVPTDSGVLPFLHRLASSTLAFIDRFIHLMPSHVFSSCSLTPNHLHIQCSVRQSFSIGQIHPLRSYNQLFHIFQIIIPSHSSNIHLYASRISSQTKAKNARACSKSTFFISFCSYTLVYYTITTTINSSPSFIPSRSSVPPSFLPFYI